MKVLHGEQGFKLHKPIPTEATVVSSARVTEVQDKEKAAIVKLEAETHDKATGDLLFTNTFSIFCRGEGGFGGERGPSAGQNAPPERKPDIEIQYDTRPDQALLYRLSGDRNPLHSDPEFAKRGGFAVQRDTLG